MRAIFSAQPEGTNLADTLVLDLWPPERVDAHFCCFEPPICGTLSGH